MPSENSRSTYAEIMARAKRAVEHFEIFADYFDKRGESINAQCCRAQADLVRYVIGEEEKTRTWGKVFRLKFEL